MDLTIRLFDLVAGNLCATFDAAREHLLSRNNNEIAGHRAELGGLGERLAARHLQRRGYRIVTRNFHAPGGEIDLIALDRGTLVFVEVKTRTDDRFGMPTEAVDEEKRERIKRAAAAFPRSRRVPIRFDVVALIGAAGALRLEHLRDAFQAQ